VVEAGKTEAVLENSRLLSFSRGTFERGAMIFKNPLSRELAIRIITDGVPYPGICTKPGGAQFLCIGPWHGMPDRSDATGNLDEKGTDVDCSTAGA
jgi:hypothetical protein